MHSIWCGRIRLWMHIRRQYNVSTLCQLQGSSTMGRGALRWSWRGPLHWWCAVSTPSQLHNAEREQLTWSWRGRLPCVWAASTPSQLHKRGEESWLGVDRVDSSVYGLRQPQVMSAIEGRRKASKLLHSTVVKYRVVLTFGWRWALYNKKNGYNELAFWKKANMILPAQPHRSSCLKLHGRASSTVSPLCTSSLEAEMWRSGATKSSKRSCTGRPTSKSDVCKSTEAYGDNL